MAGQKMHVDEVDTSVDLVRRLLATQFPRWAGLPIAPVPSAGTDHALYRLGNDMVVRLPHIDWAVGQAAREAQWLPRLASSLPLAIPAPLAQGMPGAGYPWSWSIYQWLPGANATPDQVTDRQRAAQDLAEFILALQQIDPKDGLRCGLHHASRGEPLAMRDAATRAALTDLEGLIDTAAAAAAWEAALRTPAWSEPPVWIHGDLHAGNLLAYQGRLSAVIDFGCLSVGDPATDVMTAWLYLDADTRDLFRTALAVDDATWARGRGWALSVGLIALPYYRRSNPILASIALRAIDEVLADGFATVTSY